MSFLKRTYNSFFSWCDYFIMPFVLLAMRLWMAWIFWQSGQTHISNRTETISLFKEIYKVPYIEPDIAYYIVTATELICPVLLAFGLLTRLATVPMLIMTSVIQFAFLSSIDHFYWAVMLGTVMCRGAGVFSLDHLFNKR